MGYEHTAILGNTIEEIAKAKAGIISAGCDVILAAQDANHNTKDALKIKKVVSEICNGKNAVLHITDLKNISKLKEDLNGQEFETSYYK